MHSDSTKNPWSYEDMLSDGDPWVFDIIGAIGTVILGLIGIALLLLILWISFSVVLHPLDPIF